MSGRDQNESEKLGTFASPSLQGEPLELALATGVGRLERFLVACWRNHAGAGRESWAAVVRLQVAA